MYLLGLLAVLASLRCDYSNKAFTTLTSAPSLPSAGSLERYRLRWQSLWRARTAGLCSALRELTELPLTRNEEVQPMCQRQRCSILVCRISLHSLASRHHLDSSGVGSR